MSVRQQLNALEFSGLIRIAQVEPEIEYLFRHALVQEAAYESLFKADRKLLHLLVGEAIEDLYPDRLDDLSVALGQHFYNAGDRRALKYCLSAGDTAFRQNANAEAVDYYLRAWEVARWEDVSASTEQLTHLCARLGRALQLTNRYPDSAAFLEQVVAMARERSDRVLELAAQVEQATIFSTISPLQDFERGKALSAQTLALARQLGDRIAEAKSLWNLMLPDRFSGNVAKAIEYGEQAQAIARQLDLRELIAYVLSDLTSCYTINGNGAQATASLMEANALWKELGNLPMVSSGLGLLATQHYYTGKYDRAIAHCEEAYELSLALDNLWGQAFAGLILDLAYLAAGLPDKALAVNERTVTAAFRAGLTRMGSIKQLSRAYILAVLGALKVGLDLARSTFDSMTVTNDPARFNSLSFLIYVHIFNGNLDEAEVLIQAGQEQLKRGITIMNSFLANELPKAAATCALAAGDYPRALAFIEQAETDIRRWGLNTAPPDLYYLKGKVQAGMGNVDAARETLQRGYEQAEAGGGKMTQWKILALLGQIEAQTGHSEVAESYYQRARAILLDIADNIGNLDLRESFISLPEVHEVLDDTARK